MVLNTLAAPSSTATAQNVNHSPLDASLDTFEALLQQTVQLVLQRYKTLPTDNAYAGVSPPEIRQWFDEALPESGMDPEILLQQVKAQVLDTATLNIGPHMYAYVMTCGNQISILAELMAAAINQNGGKWHLAPALSELEQRVVQWGADFIGYSQEGEQDIGGVLVSGGSAANLTCLTIARNLMAPEAVNEQGLFGLPPMVVYTSDQVHGCMDKSVQQLGIGTNHLRKIPSLPNCTIDIVALEAAIQQDLKDGLRPFCIVGNAGTVNTGAIDPLNPLADLCEKYDLWFHVDGAYGGLAAAVPEKKALYNGMDRADSVAIDFHKWLYQPYEAGCAMVKNWRQMRQTYYKAADYLSTDASQFERLDLNEYSFQLSRNFKALKVWMTFKTYGADLLRQSIARDIGHAEYLAEKLDASPEFARMS
ncbi:MAG: aminotransferase class I/II-fold pyridoxal phosphate-dependent enzyme, partial [Vampirovibrio sp.]|nr:aminotransferase class I/II-fold pyridoxal phosphate-dependent enzyme [Vampirovibrio sp.]